MGSGQPGAQGIQGPIGPAGPIGMRGEQGLRGEQGFPGKDPSPKEVADNLISQNEFLNRLAASVNTLTGENSIASITAKSFIENIPEAFPSSVGNILSTNARFISNLSSQMSNQVLSQTGANSLGETVTKSFIDKMPAAFQTSLGNTLSTHARFISTIRDQIVSETGGNSLRSAAVSGIVEKANDIAAALGNNTTFITDTSKELGQNSDLIKGVSSELSTSGKNVSFVNLLTRNENLITSLAKQLTENREYANKIRGAPGDFGDANSVRENLAKFTLICTTAGSCSYPNPRPYDRWNLNITTGSSSSTVLQFNPVNLTTGSAVTTYGNLVLGPMMKELAANNRFTSGSLVFRNGDWVRDIADGNYDNSETRYNSAIVNDTREFKALLLVGNAAESTNSSRKIKLYDDVHIEKNLDVQRGNVHANQYLLGESGGKAKFKVYGVNNGSVIASDLPGANRLHIFGDESLYLLNKSGVIVGKEWGGNGNLQVQGETHLHGPVAIRDNLRVGGTALNNGDYFDITPKGGHTYHHGGFQVFGQTHLHGPVAIRDNLNVNNGIINLSHGWRINTSDGHFRIQKDNADRLVVHNLDWFGGSVVVNGWGIYNNHFKNWYSRPTAHSAW